MTRIKKIIVLLFIFSISFSFADSNKYKQIVAHFKTDGALGASCQFGYRHKRIEGLLGFQNYSRTLFGGLVSIDTFAPSIGCKLYLSDELDQALSFFVGSDIGWGTGDVNVEYFATYFGVEYFMAEDNTFSVSSEYGYKSQKLTSRISFEVEDADVSLIEKSMFFSLGINYYFDLNRNDYY